MRIGIDARFFGSLGKGLGRYSQKLIENLEKIDSKNQYFIFLRKDNFSEYTPVNSNFKKILADFKWYSFEEQISFPRLLKKYNLDLVHFPHFNIPIFYRKNFIVTIHDLILLHFPTLRNTTLHPLWYKCKFFVYKKVIKRALLKSKKVIAVSQFTKKDILKEFPDVPKNKINVTYEAAENFCFFYNKSREETFAKYGIMKPYLLYVGNAYPHKNLENLVMAFKEIKKKFPFFQLVLVGKEDYFYKKLKEFVKDNNINEGIIFAGFIPDNELDLIFKEATLYVWPSLYEGFGLSPLEAMSKGTPVISSNHPCMREILENSAEYFDGQNVRDITQKITALIVDKRRLVQLKQAGYQQVKKYDWEKMARETLDMYDSCSS